MKRLMSFTVVPILLSAYCVPLFSDDGFEPPLNPYLADSPWPMLHRNPYQQASSPHPGPESTESCDLSFLKAEPVSIGLLYSGIYSSGGRVLWGNTLRKVYKIDPNGKTWDVIDTFKRKQSIARALSGAYTVLDNFGIYYVPRGRSIDAYGDTVANDAYSPIEKKRSFQIPDNQMADTDERIVGMNMTYDGWLAFVTDRANVGVVSRSMDRSLMLRLADEESISNSIAVDENGGIYIVTSKKMYRVEWDGTKLSVKWAVAYQTGKQPVGGLGTGSGTTPTLMGTAGGDRFVVIADAQKLMHLVLFWRDEIPPDWAGLSGRDRRIAAEVPIRFGNSLAEASFTEQSVLVRGYGAVVVNNAYGKLFPWGRGVWSKATIFMSNSKGVAPYGMEKFMWDSGLRELKSAWANAEISCPNGFPTMSSSSGLVYCIGQRDEEWNLEAVNWDSGRSAFYVPFGSSRARYNSFYAATEIGLEGNILSGVFGGFVRVGP